MGSKDMRVTGDGCWSNWVGVTGKGGTGSRVRGQTYGLYVRVVRSHERSHVQYNTVHIIQVPNSRMTGGGCWVTWVGVTGKGG
jgi:hypothetical protein